MENLIKRSLEASLIAGHGEAPFVCLTEKSPQKEVVKLKKRLKAAENWRICKNTVWSCEGISFNGIASWGKNMAVFLNGHEHRFRVLQIDRLDRRTYYAIPISMADNFSCLPDIELNAKEIRLIKSMADELSVKGPVAEMTHHILHPAKPTLIENRNRWDNENVDFSELLWMMKNDHVFRYIVIAALSAQYRSFLPGTAPPEGVYNFVILPKSRDSDLWFYAILQALTFVNAPGKNMAGPITITLKEADDLKRWRHCYERLAVIRTATGALLWPLLENIEEREQTLKSGMVVSHPLPTVPISLTRSYLHHPQAIDIPLPTEPSTLTNTQLDLLRAAMSLLLRRKIAEAALQAWEEHRTHFTAYRTNGFVDWQEQLLKVCVQTWFPGLEHQPDRALILSDAQRKQEEQKYIIAETLQRGLDLLTNPSRYIGEIIERPSSRAEWRAAVQKGILAFWFQPTRGGDEGATFLAFTPDTLKALLTRAGCTESFYEAFIERCMAQELLDKRNRTVKLGKDEISAVTFIIGRPQKV